MLDSAMKSVSGAWAAKSAPNLAMASGPHKGAIHSLFSTGPESAGGQCV